MASDLSEKGQFGSVLDVVAGPGCADDEMIKLIFVLRRREHLSETEFKRYWRAEHAPLVRRHAAALRLRRYVQSHTVLPEMNALLRDGRSASAAYDGVAEIWVRVEDLSAHATSQAQDAAAALLADERKFIDLPSSALWWAREVVVIDAGREVDA
jgi:hypothetical protein